MSKFIVIIESLEAIATSGNTLTKQGEKMLVVKEPEGWVEATSRRIHFNEIKSLPNDVKTFDSYEDAEKFAKRWNGHPWYCKPSGKFEILEVKPVYEKIVKGYELNL